MIESMRLKIARFQKEEKVLSSIPLSQKRKDWVLLRLGPYVVLSGLERDIFKDL